MNKYLRIALAWVVLALFSCSAPNPTEIRQSAAIESIYSGLSGTLFALDPSTESPDDLTGLNAITEHGTVSVAENFGGQPALEFDTGDCLTVDGASEPLVAHRVGADV